MKERIPLLTPILEKQKQTAKFLEVQTKLVSSRKYLKVDMKLNISVMYVIKIIILKYSLRRPLINYERNFLWAFKTKAKKN